MDRISPARSPAAFGADARLLLRVAHRILARSFLGDAPLTVVWLEGRYQVRSFGRGRGRVRLWADREPRLGWVFREAGGAEPERPTVPAKAAAAAVRKVARGRNRTGFYTPRGLTREVHLRKKAPPHGVLG